MNQGGLSAWNIERAPVGEAGSMHEFVAGQLEGKSDVCRASLETYIINGSDRALRHNGMYWTEVTQNKISGTLLRMQ
jgi:hypothetical protein